jgi:DNA repair protein RecO (recombination protein O)
MRSTLSTPAIVLRSWPYGEADKIVCLLTENYGKVRGIAKGAKRSRKRFANSLEPFSLVNLRFQDRSNGGLVFLLSADLAFAFGKLDSSLEKITLASYLVELVDGLIGERDENVLVFQHLKNGMLFLNGDGAAAPLEFVTWFELTLLRLAGYQPALDGCKRCARTLRENAGEGWYFSPSDGGALCRFCAHMRKDVLPLGTAALTALTRLQQGHGERAGGAVRKLLSDAVLKEIRFVMQRFLEFHMDREIRSAAFISKFVAV